MKVIYTRGKNRVPIYLNDSQYEVVKDIKMYISDGKVVLNYDGKSKSLTSLLFPNQRAVYRIDTTVHDYRPCNIKVHKQIEGVRIQNSQHVPYYTCSVAYDGNVKRISGRYNNEEEAIIVREAYIIMNNISNAIRNKDIGLTDKAILDKYNEILNKRKAENERLQKYKELRTRRQIGNYFDYYGIVVSTSNSKRTYSASVNGVTVGSSSKLLLAQCMRNLYIIDNNIQGDKLYDVGKTVEEQRKLVERYITNRPTYGNSNIRKSYADYKGVNRSGVGKQGSYLVTVNENKVRVHIGSSKDKVIAAMMYNVHKYMIGEIKESVNDVGMSIEDQTKHILSNGYYMTDDFRFRRKK